MSRNANGLAGTKSHDEELHKKPKQSYRDAYHAGSASDKYLTLPFDLGVNACRATAMYCMSAEFAVDSASNFSFRVEIHCHRCN